MWIPRGYSSEDAGAPPKFRLISFISLAACGIGHKTKYSNERNRKYPCSRTLPDYQRREVLPDRELRPNAAVLYQSCQRYRPLDVHIFHGRSHLRSPQPRTSTLPLLHRRQSHRELRAHRSKDPHQTTLYSQLATSFNSQLSTFNYSMGTLLRPLPRSV